MTVWAQLGCTQFASHLRTCTGSHTCWHRAAAWPIAVKARGTIFACYRRCFRLRFGNVYGRRFVHTCDRMGVRKQTNCKRMAGHNEIIVISWNGCIKAEFKRAISHEERPGVQRARYMYRCCCEARGEYQFWHDKHCRDHLKQQYLRGIPHPQTFIGTVQRCG